MGLDGSEGMDTIPFNAPIIIILVTTYIMLSIDFIQIKRFIIMMIIIIPIVLFKQIS